MSEINEKAERREFVEVPAAEVRKGEAVWECIGVAEGDAVPSHQSAALPTVVVPGIARMGVTYKVVVRRPAPPVSPKPEGATVAARLAAAISDDDLEVVRAVRERRAAPQSNQEA